MRYPPTRQSRSGAILVETAIVYPVFILFLLAIIIKGIGVYQYDMLACAAQEGARTLSMRGAAYSTEAKVPAYTQQKLRDEVVVPTAVGVPSSQIVVQAEWVDGTTGNAMPWDDSPRTARTAASDGTLVANSARVTIYFDWRGGMFGQHWLRGRAEVPMQN